MCKAELIGDMLFIINNNDNEILLIINNDNILHGKTR
jgi:hypothetical protein